MRNIILLLAAGTLLAGCASAPSGTEKKSDSALAPAAPTYSEKVATVNLTEFKPATACPADGKFESPDWRKVAGYANACVKAKDWRKVENIGNYLAKNAHLTPWGAYYLSLAAASRKDYPRATWMLELALKKAPTEGLFHYQLGRLHWEMGNDTDALKEMKLASDMNPSLTDAHYVTGQLALQKGDNSEAEKRFRKALAIDPKHVGSTMGIATLRMKAGDWAKAEGALEDAVALSPRSTRARLALAQVREQQLKKFQEALDTYKELRALQAQKKLDEITGINLDEKISTLEKSIAQAAKENQVSQRKPSNQEGQVAK
jgi:tetratricopeptide (TPR) repeat protein